MWEHMAVIWRSASFVSFCYHIGKYFEQCCCFSLVWLVLPHFNAAIITKIWQVLCFMGLSPSRTSAWLLFFVQDFIVFARTNNVAVWWKAMHLTSQYKSNKHIKRVL
jgi:hypothetical protein